MELSGEDLAGVVDLFGGLTRAELGRAVEELAFKRGEESASERVGDAVDDTLESYHLVAVRDDADANDDGPLLVAGPAAFPELPDGAEDLPHIMDVPERSIDRERAARGARAQLESDADAAVEAGDADRAAVLVDASYDLEAWGPIDAAEVRDRLDEV